MFKQIIKKLNNPTILCNVFFIASLILIIERGFSIISLMRNASVNLSWNGFEYTLALMLPLAYFAYFCVSKYAKNQSNKIRAFLLAGVLFILIGSLMCAQISCNLLWYIFSTLFGPEAITHAQLEFPKKLYSAMFWGSIYFPAIYTCAAFNVLIYSMYGPDSKGVLKGMAPVAPNHKAMPTGDFTCEIKVCNDGITGQPIIIPENRRMEATLIQGATGTGKTSTLLYPMCARDIEKKFFFMETSKKLAFEALQKGLAYVNVPLSNEEINKTFTLDYLTPIKGKEQEYNTLIKDLIKYIDPVTKKPIYKNLGITVVEPDGKYVSDFKKVAANFGIEVLTIDPEDPNSYGINPFVNKNPDKAASIIATILQSMYDSDNPGSNNIFFGQVTQQALENIAILLKVMYPRMNNGELPTLEDMLKMLYDYNIVETMCEEMKKDKELAEEYKILIKYFEKNFYKPPYDINGRAIPGTVGSGRRETEQFLYGATTQLDNLMRHEAVKEILCCRDHNLDFDEVLAKGQCVAVCTRRGDLGALLAKPFGMFFILSMQDAVLRRPGNENTRIPHFLYIDEFPDFVNKETETCFTLFRKYRCAMTVAIQNLSQLARSESMKFYKQVVVSNTKTHLIFGDTNAEDSQYWSDAFGMREVIKTANSLKTVPLDQVKEGSTGISTESYAGRVDFTEKIKPHVLNQLPFKSLYYTYRDAKGDMKKGKGKTDFIEKKYLSKHELATYDFARYITYLPDNDHEKLSTSENNIISQTNEENKLLNS